MISFIRPGYAPWVPASDSLQYDKVDALLDRIDLAREPPRFVIDVANGVSGGRCLRIDEFVGAGEDTSEVVEFGDAPLLVDHLPATSGACELEEESLR